MKIFATLAVLMAALILPLPAAAAPNELLVAAASSLTDALTGLQAEAEAAAGAKILFNFGASGTLRKQITEGAPVDVFFSAATEDMDSLQKAGLLEPGSRKDLLTNGIVLVGGEGQAKPADMGALKALLASASLLALGNPDSVPAGRYAAQALKALELFSIVEKKLVLGGNVRQVLQYVESGSAPLGIVFSTDASSVKAGSPVKTLWRFPESALATPVLYPVAIVAASVRKAEAAKLVAFLQGPIAREAFARAGFGLR
ncbi:molybdate ABC transporter substrate-binding protein [bacterium]|nr:molybdate ABC transporter substrate-binding protein [bacterium]